MTEPPPPPDVAADPPRHGCLRVLVIMVLLVIAASAAVALLVDEWRRDEPTVSRSTPSVVGKSPTVGVPPAAIPISSTLRRRVADSVVRVSGTACNESQQGSGFVVKPGYVVTDAHVVAGERRTSVIDHSGRRIPATVVRFDPELDLALLRLDTSAGRALPVLPLADAHAPADLAVFGHPGGGSLRIAPAHLAPTGFVDAISRDIYGRDVPGTREILALAAHLAPGDSGAPVVDQEGRVVGVAFAIDPGGKPVAYALTNEEIATLLPPATQAVSTGPCISI